MSKFDDNVQELISILETIPSLRIVDSNIRTVGENESSSAGEFSIDFMINDHILGLTALEFISRAIAIYQAQKDTYFLFGFHVKNYRGSKFYCKGIDVAFTLDWHDGTGNDGYIYDEEIEKLSKILRKILPVAEESFMEGIGAR